MGRPGLYRSDVEKARRALLSRGLNPSIDLLRTELGNTGSRSTIHRLLKEIETDNPASGPTGERVGLSDALGDLVSRLAEQLQQEANAIVADAEARHRAEQALSTAALESQRQESTRFAASLQKNEVMLATERDAHEATRAELAKAQLTLASQAAQLDGLAVQLGEREERIASLEQKHTQSREALEHFRTAAKEQREQEIRRHDHALQTLQLELRQAGDALTAKNHELQQLHRDNGRLLEQQVTQERELTSVRDDLRVAAGRSASLEADVLALHDAARQHASVLAQRDALADRLRHVEGSLQTEIETHRQVTTERDRLLGRLQALEDIVKRLEHRPVKKATRQDAPPIEESPSSG